MEAESNPIVPCSSCGVTLPRGDMFGPDDALQCPNCAQGIRERMRTRTVQRYQLQRPVLTAGTLGLAAVLYLMGVALPGGVWPTWDAAFQQHPDIWRGEAWRNLTNIFFHGGLLHLAMNGMALWFLGRIVESIWGRGAYALVLLGTGLAGSALSFVFGWDIRSVGLSGAVFGLAGFMWAQRRTHPVAAAVMTEQLRRGLLAWLAIGIVLAQTGTFPIDNWGHGGGLAMGFLFGWAWAYRARLLALAGCLLLLAALTYASVKHPLGSSEHLLYQETFRYAPPSGRATGAEWRTWYLNSGKRQGR